MAATASTLLQAPLAQSGDWSLLLVAITIVGELLAILFVYRVLVRGGSPASTLLWVAVILATPWLGLGLYYLFPRRLQLRRLRRVRVRSAKLRGARGRPGRGQPSLGRGDLAALLAGDDGAGLVGGNQVAWLPDGEQFFAAAETAIGAARLHVHCVVYILRPDATGLRFLAVLERASRRGVAVRLVYDSFGSVGLGASHLQALRAAGGRAEAFLPILWKRRPFTINLRNHRKLLVCDGAVGFVGGRNVADEYMTDRFGEQRHWLDAMVQVRGPAVERLQEVFVEDWCTATDEVLTDVFPPPPPAGSFRVGVVCSGPDREFSDLWFAVVQAIGEARSSIDLSSPYLVPPSQLLFALQLAATRGVRVRIFTNGERSEAWVLHHAQRSFYARLLASGIEIHESVDDYNHTKVLVVDARVVAIGSANMDLRSANLNFEIAVVVLDAPQLADDVIATIEQRRVGSRRIRAGDLPTGVVPRLLDAACGLLSPIL
ncbi:MAG: phospholipase D-like domain-containing protein [Planctomycetota bacterium]